MRITTKALKILALMAGTGPKYGSQLCDMAPELFSDVSRVGSTRRGNPTTNIYVLLRRMEDAKLIQMQKNFHPDVADNSPQAGQRKWYTITAVGRKALAEAKAALEV